MLNTNEASPTTPPPATTTALPATTTSTTEIISRNSSNNSLSSSPTAEATSGSSSSPKLSPVSSFNTLTGTSPVANLIDVQKLQTELFNLAYYFPYGKPLYDGTGTYWSYVYGVGKEAGYVTSRTGTYDGITDGIASDYAKRFALFSDACNAVLSITVNEFSNQIIRDKLAAELQAIVAKSYGNRFYPGLLAWVNGYIDIHKDDNKARAWVVENQRCLNTELLNTPKTSTELLNESIDTSLLIIPKQMEEHAAKLRKQYKDAHIKNLQERPLNNLQKADLYIQGILHESIVDACVHYNLDKDINPSLSYDAKSSQKYMPSRVDFHLAFGLYKLFTSLHTKENRPLSIINRLYLVQKLHYLINQEVNLPANAVEIDLQSNIIKAMLLQKDKTLLREQVKRYLKQVFEKSEDRKAYSLDVGKFSDDNELFNSLQKAKVPNDLIDALKFKLGVTQGHDCKTHEQAIASMLKTSKAISNTLIGLLKERAPKSFDKQLANDFLVSAAKYTDENRVKEGMNVWLNPQYVKPAPEAEKKSTANSTLTNNGK